MKRFLPIFTFVLGIFCSIPALAEVYPSGRAMGYNTEDEMVISNQPENPETLATDPELYGSINELPPRLQMVGQRTFVFSPRLLQWAAYDEDGYRVASGKANGGANYCAELHAACETPQGIYHVYREGDVDCVSKTFPLGRGGAAMPYCMFFRNGFAIHGSEYISNYNTSHGCIRVHTEDRKSTRLNSSH